MKRILKLPNISKVIVFIFLSILISLHSNVLVTAIPTPKLSIKVIYDINVAVKQGDKYQLPSTVKAIMNDNSTQQVGVVWSVDTGKLDKYSTVFEGIVQGYNKKVKLTLSAKKYIKVISDVNVTVNQGGKYTLPTILTATMSDGNTQQVGVTWNTTKVDTNKAGSYNFEGTVQGYSKKVRLTLTVKAMQIIIVSVQDINVTVDQNENYVLPNTITAMMSNNSTKQVGVTWNTTKVDTSKLGSYNFEAVVSGYIKKVKLTLNVIKALNDDRGNTTGNIANDGFAAKKGDWIYYANVQDGNKLYKMKDDKKSKIKLSDDNRVSNINVKGDWIYYEAEAYSNGNNSYTEYKIYKIKIDGTSKSEIDTTSKSKITSRGPSNINVVGEYIYYSNTDGLNRINVDGTEKRLIDDNSAESIIVDGDWIYCTQYADGSYQLNKIKIDGTQKTTLNSLPSAAIEEFILSINVIGEWIYYAKPDGVYKMKVDGMEETKLTEDKGVYYVNVDGDSIYYSSYNGLYKVNTNGLQKTIVLNYNLGKINILGDWIYFFKTQYNEDSIFYRMKKDGSGQEVISTSVTGIDITPTFINLEKNKKYQLGYTVYPVYAENKKVKWSSSNNDLVTVDENGGIIAKAKGQVIIKVISEDGNKIAQCIVNVVD